jgi:hypothetical protein
LIVCRNVASSASPVEIDGKAFRVEVRDGVILNRPVSYTAKINPSFCIFLSYAGSERLVWTIRRSIFRAALGRHFPISSGTKDAFMVRSSTNDSIQLMFVT